MTAIALPIGISFFTFTQIAFLVDCRHGKVHESHLINYVLFVSYFPHLIAGPILHHAEMMPQFAAPASSKPSASNFAIGLSIFVIGLCKKVLIADSLATMVTPVFAAGAHPPLLEAWIGTLAYTFQLYFDFSGYCDMAIGLSLLFGIRLPLNFNSPYKARDISAFWRRWHMTLSRFLRDYLYVPLGGSRHGPWRRYRNLMLTMLLGGLWHGAGWTFIVWGALHGAFLALHHGWRAATGETAWRRSRWYAGAGAVLTFLCVMLAWVFFRAPDLDNAVGVLAGLAGLNGVGLPRGLLPLAGAFQHIGLAATFDGIRWIDFGGLGPITLAVAMLLAFLAPNTQEIFCHYETVIERIFHSEKVPKLVWRPSTRWSVTLAALLTTCLFCLDRPSEFLYFQF
jgi:D-alanyl-lipoteichoic acid acyltransferase DltB (MBOAT superfamily)